MFPGTLSQHAKNTLALLGKQDFLKSAYMAGGSSLALQLGHRISVDFDFFTDTEFDLATVKKSLARIGNYKSTHEAPKSIVGELNGVKLSLFYYSYPLIAPTTEFLGTKLVSLADIAAMKLVAITDRGTKKDYIDLYLLAKKCFSIQQMFEYYDKKYHSLEVNRVTLLKALQYFDDADNSGMPVMVEKIKWDTVKRFFEREVVRLAEKYL
ncbi:MAG: nucleotidyl transferase AbiEii/AbiGii toxin family protein [Patescibacteria group bacterium]